MVIIKVKGNFIAKGREAKGYRGRACSFICVYPLSYFLI